MSDGWSLKGKKNLHSGEMSWGDSDGNGLVFSTDTREYCFCDDAVELLRQRLIEDVEKLFPFVAIEGKLISTTGIEIKHIINKRFGVE